MKPIEYHLDKNNIKRDFKTQYIRYRTGRIKHELWLKNRKSNKKIIYKNDEFILKNCQTGKNIFFNSAGYYIKDLFPEHHIDVVESNPIVKNFYPATVVASREELPKLKNLYDNFVITNSRAEHWITLKELEEHFELYCKIMNKGCRFFYSFRDTQMLGFNRLKDDMKKTFLDWAKQLKHTHNLTLVWSEINFPKKTPDNNGSYSLSENPDTINGNIKFFFVYNGEPWSILE